MKKIKILFMAFIILNMSLINTKENKIKLYTFYTPSHEILFYCWFLPTLQDDFEIIAKKCGQLCESGVFMKSGWVETMLFKVSMILEAIKENWNDVFIYADVDIQFFKSFERIGQSLLKDKDMLIQRNRPTGEVCAGFFICRANERTFALWQEVKDKIIANNYKKSDQATLNEIIRSSEYKGIIWDYLPNEFFGAGTIVGNNAEFHWEPGVYLKVPKDIILHHANFTKGVENKIKQFLLIREQVSKNM